ncbi:unnamed protein product [Dovyalis caffra]|uniref:Uncharacterized protein n=1 Tax=Dovyalis caffra TaxID=77055 RepID=A0AAV1SXA7_9ROSI|nr:unnamed protein product [Dovyalis caffra]
MWEQCERCLEMVGECAFRGLMEWSFIKLLPFGGEGDVVEICGSGERSLCLGGTYGVGWGIARTRAWHVGLGFWDGVWEDKDIEDWAGGSSVWSDGRVVIGRLPYDNDLSENPT